MDSPLWTNCLDGQDDIAKDENYVKTQQPHESIYYWKDANSIAISDGWFRAPLCMDVNSNWKFLVFDSLCKAFGSSANNAIDAVQPISLRKAHIGHPTNPPMDSSPLARHSYGGKLYRAKFRMRNLNRAVSTCVNYVAQVLAR